MKNFISAINAGLKAAETAEKNKEEISAVFDEVNSQLERELEGMLKIFIGEYYVNNTLQDLAAIANLRRRETYKSIVASHANYQDCPDAKLARWEVDRNGYPCRIFLGKDEYICEDKESLIYNLEVLHSDPVVGDKIYKIINFVPREQSEDNESNIGN